MKWSHIVIEGFCSHDGDVAPCGKGYPGVFCLGDGGEPCPMFGWGESSERESSFWVPLRLVICDRLAAKASSAVFWFTWHLWYRWRSKDDRSLDGLREANVNGEFEKNYRLSALNRQAKYNIWFNALKKDDDEQGNPEKEN